MEDQRLNVDFEDDVITLDLPDVVGHWKLIPMTPPQVSKIMHGCRRNAAVHCHFPLRFSKIKSRSTWAAWRLAG